ncbi:MAG: hypothetical protein JWN76_1400 [Chitinophagaceae bacterium]|nr:hypothetical protein [Chitinophagaceae bacterium]
MKKLVERIKSFNESRDPGLLEMKYEALKRSPYRFFRGTCHLFYEDFKPQVNWQDDTKAWICGDLHLENFGTFKAENGLIYFDMNDFDEAILAPVTWEIARTLTSIHLLGVKLKFKTNEITSLLNSFIEKYTETLTRGKAIMFERQAAEGMVEDIIDHAMERKHDKLIKQRTEKHKEERRLKTENGKALPLNKEDREFIAAFVTYWSNLKFNDRYIFKDAALRIAGTGSLGLKRYIILCWDNLNEEFVLLDMKEAKPSSLAPYTPYEQPYWNNEAIRIVSCQEKIQYLTPALLTAVAFQQSYFVIKVLQPSEDQIDFSSSEINSKKFKTVLETMAVITASGQLRSCGRQGSSTADELMNFGLHHKQWQQPLLHFVETYAEKVKEDYREFCESM